LKDHGAEESYGARTEDQSAQPWDVETETGMDRSEYVNRLGGDSEGLDQDGDLFKDTGNRHEEALLFDRVLAEKTVGANDPTLAELACLAEILPFLSARRAVRILTRASHCRDDEITRASPGYFGTDLHNLG
jgi:hypothetical protein